MATAPKPTPKTTTTKKIATPSKPKKAVAKKVPLKKKVTTTKKTKVLAPKKITATKKKVAVAKKKVVQPPHIYHKAVPKRVQPSPKPKWPPVGYTSIGSAYARVPTGAELIGILSAMKNPTAAINSCALDPKNPSAPAYACAAILVGSTEKCTWWRISATITGIDPSTPTARVSLGDLTTFENGAAAKTIQTIFLVSPVPLQTGIRFTAIHALCGIGPSTDPVPSTSFTVASSATPTPSPSPSPSNS